MLQVFQPAHTQRKNRAIVLIVAPQHHALHHVPPFIFTWCCIIPCRPKSFFIGELHALVLKTSAAERHVWRNGGGKTQYRGMWPLHFHICLFDLNTVPHIHRHSPLDKSLFKYRPFFLVWTCFLALQKCIIMVRTYRDRYPQTLADLIIHTNSCKPTFLVKH